MWMYYFMNLETFSCVERLVYNPPSESGNYFVPFVHTPSLGARHAISEEHLAQRFCSFSKWILKRVVKEGVRVDLS